MKTEYKINRFYRNINFLNHFPLYPSLHTTLIEKSWQAFLFSEILSWCFKKYLMHYKSKNSHFKYRVRNRKQSPLRHLADTWHLRDHSKVKLAPLGKSAGAPFPAPVSFLCQPGHHREHMWPSFHVACLDLNNWKLRKMNCV